MKNFMLELLHDIITGLTNTIFVTVGMMAVFAVLNKLENRN